MTISAHRGGENLSDKTFSGFVKFIHPEAGWGFIECDDSDSRIFVLRSLVDEHDLKADDSVSFIRKETEKGYAVAKFTEVRGSIVSSDSNSGKGLWSFAVNAKDKVRSLLHLFALGDNKGASSRAEDRRDSLTPYIEYVTHSLNSADYFREKARFIWEEIPRPRTFEVTKGMASCIEIRSEYLPYVHRDWPRDILPQMGAKLISTKTGNVYQFVRSILKDGDMYFLTTESLDQDDELLIPGEERIELVWESSGTSVQIENVSMDGETVKIINQDPEADRGKKIRLIIGRVLKGDEKLEFDGRTLDWELKNWTPNGGPLWDENDIQITDSFTINTPFTVIEEVVLGNLRDRDGIEYICRETDSQGKNQHLLKLELEKPVGEEDLDPLEVLFSPDRDYSELEMHRTQGEMRPNTLRIKGFERERRAIWVEELPKSEVLKLPAYTKYLKRQKDMLENLRDYPLAHHEMLLNLTTREEDNNNLSSQWPDFTINRLRENEWNRLTQDTNGTDTQRDFVERALSTEDFCLMQGPPGSGKTTAICELIIQLAKRGDSVLLCGSTQASIDNVLNRVCDEDEISVLRIGNQKNIFDENVKRWSLENQVSELKMKLRSSKEVESMDGLDLATNLVLQKTNLTCGTVEGILNHPLIGARTTWRGDEIQRPQAIWDYLIVDEASKTTFQQFIVPAAFAKRWVLVGDVAQLPPFIETSEVETNLESVTDHDGDSFSESEQRACLVLNQIMKKKGALDINNNPYVLIEPDNVVTAIEIELRARSEDGKLGRQFALIHPEFNGKEDIDELMLFHPSKLGGDSTRCAKLLSADVIIVPNSFEVLNKVVDYIPSWAHYRFNGINPTPSPEDFPIRHLYRLQCHGFKDEMNGKEWKRNRFQHPLAKENLLTRWPYQISWRLNRSYELKTSNNDGRAKYEQQIKELMPRSKDISVRINEIRSIALPSILECLQEGFTSYGGYELPYKSTLTDGFPESAKDLRFSMIEFQHRMHPDISSFPLNEFYKDKKTGKVKLKDADTLQKREQRNPFLYMQEREYDSRRIWLDVYEGDVNGGGNRNEVAAIREELKTFLEWTKTNPPPQRNAGEGEGLWEIAILSPYNAQRLALRDMVRKVTGLNWESRFNPKKWPVSIIVSSTDRFQGQEADMVFISLRNTGRIGFLDSPNRMNVALTRAREALFLVGHWGYFAGIESGSQRMDDPMLKSLATSFLDNNRKKYRKNRQ
jgi:cold shock CspA family protein